MTHASYNSSSTGPAAGREAARASLDVSGEVLSQALSAAATAISEYLASPRKPIVPSDLSVALRQRLTEPLPQVGVGLAALIAEVVSQLYPNATRTIDPGFLTMISTGGNPYGLVGDLLARPLNQHVARRAVSPMASAVEDQVLRWIGEFIGFSRTAQGVMTGGGSLANLTALAAAVVTKADFDVRRDGLYGGPRLCVYTSEEAHQSIDKAMSLLGLGAGQLRRIPSRADFTVDLGALASAIARDRSEGNRPICVVANGGSVNTGAIDPLAEIAELCCAEDLWFHVDAAYGGPAAGVEVTRGLFRGLERADSVTVDAHKWLYSPYEAGCLLVHDTAPLRKAFQFDAVYAAAGGDSTDYMDLSVQMSRDFKALRVWSLFVGAGANAVRACIANDITVMHDLALRLRAHPRFEVLAPTPLSVVCFRYVPDQTLEGVELDALNARLGEALRNDGRALLGVTQIRGRTALRACCVNYRLTTDVIAELVEVIAAVGAELCDRLQATNSRREYAR